MTKSLKKQILGFLAAGILANLISFSLFFCVYRLLLQTAFVSSIIGQLLGLTTNYLVNSRLVFKKSLKLKSKVVYSIYYGSSIYIVGLTIQRLILLGFDYRISWFMTVAIAAICNILADLAPPNTIFAFLLYLSNNALNLLSQSSKEALLFSHKYKE